MWESFFALEGDRSLVLGGMGGAVIRPLPYTAKARWLDDHGYGGAARARIERLWSVMDGIYLEHHREAMQEAEEERKRERGE